MNEVALRSWSRTQPCVALSSAEAEYYALAVGIQEALLVQSVLRELGFTVEIIAHTDSSAAKQAAEKVGCLKQKHMQLKDMFVKDMLMKGMLTIEKVGTLDNPADMLTKALSAQKLEACLHMIPSWKRSRGTHCENA